MLSGPDLITYIGVPLTLTGLVQIFILGKALWILCHLYLSIPKELRSFYSLYPDPSSGTVLVLVKTPFCTRPGLLEEMRIEGAPPSTSQRLQTWCWETSEYLKAISNQLRRRSHYPEAASEIMDPPAEEKAIGVRTSLPDNHGQNSKHSLRPKKFIVEPLNKLRRSWMDAAINCGFAVSHFPKNHSKAQNRLTTRLRIDQTFDLERPTPLAMRWSDFGWFALALGVNVLEFPAIKNTEKIALGDVHTAEEAMSVYNDGINWHAELVPCWDYTYSIQRALAWFEVMCFRDTFGTVSFRRLGEPSEDLLRPNFFDAFEPEAPDFDDSLDAALTWISYMKNRRRSATEESANNRQVAEPDLHQERSDSLRDYHVSPRLLEIREKSLCYLKRLDDQDLLEGILLSLFEQSFSDDLLAAETPLPPSEATGAFIRRLRELFRRSQYVRYSLGLSYTLKQLESRVKSKSFEETENFFENSIMEFRALEAGRYSDESGDLDMTKHIQRTCFEFKGLLELFDPHRGKDFAAQKDDERMHVSSDESTKTPSEESSQLETVSVLGRMEETGAREGDTVDRDARDTSESEKDKMRRDTAESSKIETKPTAGDVKDASGSEDESAGGNPERSDSPEVDIVQDAEDATRPAEGHRPSNIQFHKHILVAIQDWESFPRTEWKWRISFSKAIETVERELWTDRGGLARSLSKASEIAKEGVYAAPDSDIVQSFFDSENSDMVVYLH